jgi:hypothetical protein
MQLRCQPARALNVLNPRTVMGMRVPRQWSNGDSLETVGSRVWAQTITTPRQCGVAGRGWDSQIPTGAKGPLGFTENGHRESPIKSGSASGSL